MTDSRNESLYFNGIDGTTGRYLVPPVPRARIAELARREVVEPRRAGLLKRAARALKEVFFGLPMDVAATDVPRAGWAVIFAEGEPPEVREALAPLIEHRRSAVEADRLKLLDYRPGEDRHRWLARHGVGPAAVDPGKVPYYLTIVGGPDRIPYEFQVLLDVEYAVGRVAFETPAQYAGYAKSVVDYEVAERRESERSVDVFGTRHPGDRATELSADLLLDPLVTLLDGSPEAARVTPVVGEEATKGALGDLVAGRTGAQVCFTASHGMGFPSGHTAQRDEQGALLCQDWPGIGEIDGSHYYAAADISDDAQLRGRIFFHFACFGAGTPEHDEFFTEAGTPPRIAPGPFVAKLPQTLLTHPNGGALAVIGHIERAWGCSIADPVAGPQLQPFSNAIRALLAGWPVGHAVKDFNEKFATVSAELTQIQEQVRRGARIPDEILAPRWIERNDARNYAILGDPAVHL
jgi:hypothetical protein